MADNRNIALDDEMMARATGGLTDRDPYGFVCEAAVISGGTGPASKFGEGSYYTVDADNGKQYLAHWAYKEELKTGDIVQLIHDDDGSYSLEPLMG